MSIFSRIFKMGQSEAHAVLDKFEDPIKLTEQGIRDLKKDLEAAMRSLAEVKASAIRIKKDADSQQKLSADYERKAMLLLQKAQSGGIQPEEADRLASESLSRKAECDSRSSELGTQYQNQQNMADNLQGKINKLKSSISSYENELITLKARAKTAKATKKINEQMAKLDSSGTISMLERMKNKVKEEESLSEAYGEIAHDTRSIDTQIDDVLKSSDTTASDSLAAMKAKMGIT